MELGQRSGMDVQAQGRGPTREAAIADATNNLTRSLWIHVSSQTTSQRTKEGEQTSAHFEELIQTFSNADLFHRKTLDTVERDGVHFAVVGLGPKAAERARERIRRKIPVYATLYELWELGHDQPFQRLERAVFGLQQARKRGVLDGSIPADKRFSTFEGAFRQAVHEAAGRIRILAVREADGTATLRAIHDEDSHPLEGVSLEVAGVSVRTDTQGRAELPEGVPEGKNLVVRAGLEVELLLQEGVLRKEDLVLGMVVFPAQTPERTRLHVHTRPEGVPVMVFRRGGEPLYDNEAPYTVNVRPGARYTLRAADTHQTHGGELETVQIHPRTSDLYFHFEPRRKRYGDLDLQAEDGARIMVRPKGGGEGRQKTGKLEDEFETGVYEIRISRPEGDYQTIRDEIRVREDQTKRRRYAAPRYRDPYFYGWRWGIPLIQAPRELADDYPLPGGTAGAYREHTGLELTPGYGVGLEGQYFADFLNLTLQGSWKYIQSAASMATPATKRYEVGELDIYAGDVAAGFHYLREDAGPLYLEALWLTGGRAWEAASWSSKDKVDLPDGRTNTAYNFGEVGAELGWLKVAVRLPQSQVGPYVELGVSFRSTASGYDRPDRGVTAKRGVHYTVPQGEEGAE